MKIKKNIPQYSLLKIDYMKSNDIDCLVSLPDGTSGFTKCNSLGSAMGTRAISKKDIYAD